MYGFIYLTTCTINNKKYIGLCSHESIHKELYLGSGKILKNAVKRYGKSNFTRVILEECSSWQELSDAEIKWIAYYNATTNTEFYNIDSGGYGGDPNTIKEIWKNRTQEQKDIIGDKISATKKRLGSSKGSKNSMYGKHTGKLVQAVWDSRTNEYKKEIGAKVSAARKEMGSAKGTNNPMYGRSAITEKNLKWYTNGIENKYITEGTQSDGFVRGRTNLSGNIGKRTNATARNTK